MDALEIISEHVGVEIEKLKISCDMNEHGQMTSIIVFTDDEFAAQAIENLVHECSSSESNTTNRTNCEGILIKFKSVKVTSKVISEARHMDGMLIFIIATMIITFLMA